MLLLGEPGGGGVAGSGQGWCACTLGALGGPDQRPDRLPADLGGIAVVGRGFQRVEVVAGDDLSDLLPVAGEDLP